MFLFSMSRKTLEYEYSVDSTTTGYSWYLIMKKKLSRRFHFSSKSGLGMVNYTQLQIPFNLRKERNKKSMAAQSAVGLIDRTT